MKRLPCPYILFSLRIRLVPLRRLGVVGDRQERERDRPVDLCQVRVIDLLPMIAYFVIVGEDERDAERVSWDSGVGQRLIVAAREKRVAVLLALVDIDAGLFAGGAKDRAEVGEVEAGERGGIQFR